MATDCPEYVCFMFCDPTQAQLMFIIQVGNQAFANYVDATSVLTHINNESAPHLFLKTFYL